MTRVSEIAELWFGLCPKPPVFRVSQANFVTLPEPAHEGSPDGGTGGPGTIRRGVAAALSGMKTLIHNPQLLWFPLLVGLVLAVHLIAQAGLYVMPEWLFFDDTGSVLPSLVLSFVAGLLTVFCLGFLLAGLVLSFSSKKDGTVSFFQGLKRAKKYLRPLTGWSVVVALAGTLIYVAGMYSYVPMWLQPYNIVSALYFKLGYFLFMVRYQFPFNFVLTPTLYIPNLPPVFGGDGWLISWALECTLILSAITAFLFLLTMFVVPLIVLDGQSLKEAILGSFTLMKKIWGEVAACVLGLGMVVFAASLAWWAAGQMYTSFTTPIEEWIAAGLLYVLALSCFAFVVVTVGGIAALDLYISAKTGQITGSPDPEPHL
jgi:hypothetical protein